jgi:hypothetical protein
MRTSIETFRGICGRVGDGFGSGIRVWRPDPEAGDTSRACPSFWYFSLCSFANPWLLSFVLGGVDWLSSLPDLCIRELCLTDGDVSRDVATRKSNPATTGMVLPAVGIACLGAILFGYHLGYFSLL